MTPLDALTIPLRGVQLVEASAGSGKTHAISTLFVRALLERCLEVSAMLVVTFTNAATFELRARIRGRLHRALAACAGGEGGPAGPDADMAVLIASRRAEGRAEADARRLTGALHGFDEAAIFTIHGFCQRVLHEFAFESGVGFDTDLLGDDRLLLADAVRDAWARALYQAPPALVRRLAAEKVSLRGLSDLANLHAARPELRLIPAEPPPDAELALLQGFFREVPSAAVAALERRKRAADVQSFDDLLKRLDAALAAPGGAELAQRIRRRFPVALIDEFQDTDALQHRIFRRVYADGDGALMLIGDPKQAIYAFRGADVGAYLRARREAAALYTLRTNRRSAPAYVAALNALFGRARAPFLAEDIPFAAAAAAPVVQDVLAGDAQDSAPLRFLFARRDRYGGKAPRCLNKGDDAAIADVAAAVVRILNADTRIGDRRVGPGDVAVLCRKNAQLRRVQEALRARGVPSVLKSDMSVFESAETPQLERVLRALAEPSDAAAVRAAITTPLLGVTGDDLERMRQGATDLERWMERFQQWHAAWRGRGFAVALQHVLDECDVAARVLALPGGERSLTNVLHLGELLHAAAVEGRRGPLALLEWLHRLRCDPAARGSYAAEAAQIRLESDEHALTLATIHQSKGLEYDVVICPFLWDGSRFSDDRKRPRFHDPADGVLTVDLGHPPAAASVRATEREALGEEVRLLYVALTRARQLGVILWGAFRDVEHSALGYVLHQSRDAELETLDEATRQRIRTAKDEELHADLADLVGASGGTISVEVLPRATGERYCPPAAAAEALSARSLSRQITQTWRTSSFSALAAGGAALDAPAEEGIDRDQGAVPALEPLAAPGPLHGFPRGRRPGTLLHKIFEVIDFTDRDPQVLRDVVARWLGVFRIAEEWTDPVCAAVRDVLQTPLVPGEPPLRLADVRSDRRLNELEFAFPVALADGGRGGLTPAALADAFAMEGSGALAQGYAERIRRLPFRSVSGYLRGFIDCVFVSGERWYVVDYKSNDLGAEPSAYAPAALAAEMVRHDYVLQAHLYTVAVHRYLQRRVHGYEYARHFGGVLYLFVRGMAPARGARTGVVFERPAPALVAALSARLAGGAGAESR
ncbi:MAG: UvrD-helicase domain-containing protein [Candidatus Binatia bacterium]